MESIKPIKLVIFDIAGTTATDDGLVVKAFLQAMDELGLGSDVEERNAHITYVNDTMGMRKLDVFLHICRGNASVAQLLHEHFVEAYSSLVRSGELKEFPGVSELFKRLTREGVGVALTTGFPREILNSILHTLEWDSIVDVSVASDEVAQGRPAPDMNLRAMALYGQMIGSAVSSNEIIVVGDTESDMQAGLSVKARNIVGVTSGAHPLEQLLAAGATHVLPSAIEVVDLVHL